MTIVVTGATGTVGRLVVQQLLDADQRVRAVTRRPADAGLPAAVEVFGADLDQPNSLARAFSGAEGLFLFPNPSTAVEVARLAERSGVRRIVTLTSVLAEEEPEDALYNLAVERAVEAVGVEWTHVRPGLFAANLLDWADAIRTTGVVREPYAGAAQTPVHELDVAAVAATALLRDGHSGKKYPLSGPEVLTKPQQVEAIGTAIGRELGFEEVSPDDWRKEVGDSMPEFVADFMLGIWSRATESPDPILSTVEDVVGRPARTLIEWAADHAADFGGERQ